METSYDFGGYVTRYNTPCEDGRVILPGAFAKQDDTVVNLVYNHDHGNLTNVLGKVRLRKKPDGIYGLARFDDTDMGNLAKQMVHSGTLSQLSICANHLIQNRTTGQVQDGKIREVSLVLAGANPGAYIDDVIEHSAEEGDTAIISFNNIEDGIEFGDALNVELLDMIAHSDSGNSKKKEEDMAEKTSEQGKGSGKTIAEIVDTMNEEQREALYAIAAMIIEENSSDKETKDEGEEMRHNAFEQDDTMQATALTDEIRHSALNELQACCLTFKDLKKGVQDFLEHSAAQYGITSIEELFPETKWINGDLPEVKDYNAEWVHAVLDGVRHVPFGKIGCRYANLTAPEARAKGYITGDYKPHQVIQWLRRESDVQTVFIATQADRDTIIDLGDNIDIIRYYASEMKIQHDTEKAQAFLIGDGRDSTSRNKIQPNKIRPIATDGDFWTVKVSVVVPQGSSKTKAELFIDQCIKNRSKYKGNGNNVLMFINEDLLGDIRSLKDLNQRYIYESDAAIANILRVKRVVAVPQFRDFSYDGVGLLGIMVDLSDYAMGRNEKGKPTLLDDFNIDYNRYKYVYEERFSGMLTAPFSALAFYDGTAPSISDTASGTWRSAEIEPDDDDTSNG